MEKQIEKLRVSAVSYTNTKPFLYGLEHSNILDKIELSLDIPADCAQKLIDDRADVGLIPVAALLRLPYYEIIGDYCIGANGAVNSVFIFSDLPVNEIKTIRLDAQSRTSNNLARILLKKYWKLDPIILHEGTADAQVLIGDRTFGRKHEFNYVYDLAEEWKNFTSLPFAFAVWAANKPISPELKQELNRALGYGITHREELLKTMDKRSDFDLDDYLLHKIDYVFDDKKHQALNLYLEYLKEINQSLAALPSV
ncbi:menaquinone biosynthetic enzyme MqnA/MqnD family protein [Solitalea lacus]|uniref:menaquinone biosynthetic enzyme MqnA/MqnD family protein n=1 Tax=Solitalea lacus TaxID=2911172 RepID=UPI001EDC8C51|nr:menaquinone biosynthesis protein [Solitalea lacus]UKJ06086.1 menaquinone biosynthesis protein [Solitalea lacus]